MRHMVYDIHIYCFILLSILMQFYILHYTFLRFLEKVPMIIFIVILKNLQYFLLL